MNLDDELSPSERAPRHIRTPPPIIWGNNAQRSMQLSDALSRMTSCPIPRDRDNFYHAWGPNSHPHKVVVAELARRGNKHYRSPERILGLLHELRGNTAAALVVFAREVHIEHPHDRGEPSLSVLPFVDEHTYQRLQEWQRHASHLYTSQLTAWRATSNLASPVPFGDYAVWGFLDSAGDGDDGSSESDCSCPSLVSLSATECSIPDGAEVD